MDLSCHCLGPFQPGWVRARDSTYLARWLSPHLLLLLSLGTSIFPPIFIFLLKRLLLWLLLLAPQQAAGRCCLVHKTFIEQLRGVQKLEAFGPGLQCWQERNPQSSTSAWVHVSTMPKHSSHFEVEERHLLFPLYVKWQQLLLKRNNQAQTPRETFKERALLLLLGAPLPAAGFPFFLFLYHRAFCFDFSHTDTYSAG